MSFLRSRGLGFKLSAFVLLGFVVSFAATSLYTSRTLKEEARENLLVKAGAITAQALSTLEYVDGLHAQGVFDDAKLLEEAHEAVSGARDVGEIIEAARGTRIYRTLPVVSAWRIAQEKASEYGFEFKTPRLDPRNPKNRADEIERKLLSELAGGRSKEAWLVDESSHKLHYMQPVRIKASCLSCHGGRGDDADGDGKDMFGLAMEGEKVGDLHAGFEVVCDMSGELARAAAAARNTALIGGVAAVLSILVLAFLIRRFVSRPLNRAAHVLGSVAAGDFTQRLGFTGEDELGRMARSLDGAVTDIAAAMSEVRDTSSALVDAAGELSQTTSVLSDGSQQQASALEETAASLEEITGTVRQNAESAQQARDLASASRQVAEKGSQVVANAVEAIQQISQSSERIANITATIDEIAFQTNLLALNAAVEAARAGEQGRGFAVVASEVRSLAQRSATSAREIKSLIEESQQRVRTGSDLVHRSGASLQEILDSVKRVTDIISEISEASKEQATGIDQVNRAVTQMDQVVQKNAGEATTLAQTAQGLAERAGTLQHLVERFQLEAGGRTTPARVEGPTSKEPPSALPRIGAKPSAQARSGAGALAATSGGGPARGTSADGFIEF